MRQIPLRFLICGLAAALVLVCGCGPKSPEDLVNAIRAQYTIKLENFSVEDPEPEPMDATMEEGAEAAAVVSEEVAVVAAEAAAVAGEAAEEAEEADEEMETVMETGPRPANVILHLLVRFNGEESLPGVTVEVTQADPFGQEKPPTLHFVETAGMGKSDVRQVDVRLEGMEVEDGDAFSVLLRQVVAPEARGDYREFAEAAP